MDSLAANRVPEQQLEVDIRFGASGNADKYLAEGWSFPESDYTWAVDETSAIRLPVALTAPSYFLEVKLKFWFYLQDFWPHQRLLVYVNGRFVGRTLLNSDSISVLGFYFAGENVPDASAGTVITFEHPDARSPNRLAPEHADGRVLACAFENLRLFAMSGPLKSFERTVTRRGNPGLFSKAKTGSFVKTESGLAPPDIVTQFQSIGDNLE